MFTRAGTLYTLSACANRFDTKAFCGKETSHQLAQFGVVIDHQDTA
jgi:hypothetical protein